MGLGADVLRARNPRLIYVNISGFGTRPPGDALPGFDQTAQAMSGLDERHRHRGDRARSASGIAVSDSATGRLRGGGCPRGPARAGPFTGRGAVVEASLMESTLTLMSYQAQKFLSLGMFPGATATTIRSCFRRARSRPVTAR